MNYININAQRPCRSMLYVPGNNPGLLQHAAFFGADSVLLDLEDAVAESEKDAARNLTAHFIRRSDFDNVIVTVRINGADTPFLKKTSEPSFRLNLMRYVCQNAARRTM